MPLYEVHHSHALTESQREELAGAITRLHATTFATPSIFVHVRFIREDLSDGNYFVAGTRRDSNSNNIIAHVRTSPTRTKADFDKLGERIEEAWYRTLGVSRASSQELIPSGAGEKTLAAVAFFPLLTARELGLAIPEAGKEMEWFKESLPLIKKAADSDGGDFAEMLREFEEREDLKRLQA